MLKFTESQLDALDESCTQDFIERLTLDLKKNEVGTAPELNNNELINRVKATISCAENFGLSDTYSLAMFTAISFIAGPRFYKYPVISQALQNESIQPNQRIDMAIKKMDGKWDNIEEINDWELYCGEFVTNV